MEAKYNITEITAHFRNYLVAATFFTAGKAIIQNREAIAEQFIETGATTLLGIAPIWVTITAGISLVFLGTALFFQIYILVASLYSSYSRFRRQKWPHSFSEYLDLRC